MKNLFAYCFILFFFINTHLVSANNIKAFLQNSTIIINDTISVFYELDNNLPFTNYTIKLPSYFTKINSLEKINNDTINNKQILRLILKANKEGEHLIPSLHIKTTSATLVSNTLMLTVINMNTSKAINKTETQLSEKSENKSIPEKHTNNKSEVFVKSIFKQKEYLAGEQINIAYFLYSKYEANLVFNDVPQFYNCWIEIIDSFNPIIKPKKEFINGVEYYQYQLGKYALFPFEQNIVLSNCNSVTIETSVSNSNTKNNNSTIAKGFGFDAVEKKTITVNFDSIKINITNINNKLNKTKLVGNYRILKNINKLPNNTFRLEYKIIGNGNLKFVEIPKFIFNENWMVYEPQINDSIWIENSVFMQQKNINYILVPKSKGNIKLTQSNFTFLDVSTKTFKSIVLFDTMLPCEIVTDKINLIEEKKLIEIYKNPLQLKNHFIWKSYYYWLLILLFFTLPYLQLLLKKIKFYKKSNLEKKSFLNQIYTRLDSLNSDLLDNKQFMLQTKSIVFNYLKTNFQINQLNENTIKELNIYDPDKNNLINFLKLNDEILYSDTQKIINQSDIIDTLKNTILQINSTIKK